MISSVLSTQVKEAIGDFLRTTFPFSTPAFQRTVEDLVESGRAFKGPYLSLQLPFRTGVSGRTFFPQVPLRFPAYQHQERAFQRLGAADPKPTIVATGTGSGKTESFLVPILDYCRKHAGESGIKAILIYPMNALATDQARRIARLVDGNAALKGKVRAGLYIGSRDAEPRMQMSADGVVTDRDTLQLYPPDILLTNYKMLDYMMVRPRDAQIWAGNAPDTLRFLVVDELHTFDGAQGTDLACLIRRLKARLGSSRVCSIGTSATLGSGKASVTLLREYAHAIFDAEFEEDAIVTEERITAGEFLDDAITTRMGIPVDLSEEGQLNPAQHASEVSFLQAQHQAWFEDSPSETELQTDEWRLALGERLRSHAVFQNLLKLVGSAALSYDEVASRLALYTPELEDASPADRLRVLDSLLSLVSIALRVSPASNGTTLTLPLVNIRHQLWLRELRRMVSSVSETAKLAWADDLKEADAEVHLPLVQCRDCGTAGWGGLKRKNDFQLRADLQPFYLAYFKGRPDPKVCLAFPDHDGELARDATGMTRAICPTCLYLNRLDEDVCQGCSRDGKEMIRVFLPDFVRTVDGHSYASIRCPSCESRYGLNIVGSQAASLTSVMVGQLYASRFNDDKKLLTFSDSVQDASHRAGFFQARTFRFTVRSALQQYVDGLPGPKSLADVAAGFVAHLQAMLPDEEFVGTYIAPDMTWMQDYEMLDRLGVLPKDSNLPDLVAMRLTWEVTSDFGFRARVGRTLEKTGASMASPEFDRVARVRDALLEPLRNEIGGMESLSAEMVDRFILGLLYHLRVAGAVYHPALSTYLSSMGGYFLMSQRKVPYMPRLGKKSRTPAFLTTASADRFDRLFRAKRKTWYAEWALKCFSDGALHPQEGFEKEVYAQALVQLEKEGLLERHEVQDKLVWSIPPDALSVTTAPEALRCSRCSHAIAAPAERVEAWDGAPCQRLYCPGEYAPAEHEGDYYRGLYQTADIRRIVAAEHTGLLGRDERERLEERFMNGSKAWDPNLISCTPTLEMGIDIGDLSSLILCSVPPTQSNYLQRIGRAGRRDGNALTVTVANARPHDLYFFAEPKEMLAGDVEPPGTFLDAPAVLERQLAAYGMDRWVQNGIDVMAVPPNLGKVLNQLEKADKGQFPYNWLTFIAAHEETLLSGFEGLFGDRLSVESKAHLKSYIAQEDASTATLRYKLISSLHRKREERDSIKKKIKNIQGQLKKQEEAPKDQNHDKNLGELKRERSALRGLVKALNDTNVYNFLTDEGLLPNYAFPEAGVTLQSVIYRKKSEPDEHGAYDTWTLSFDRSGSAAIRELAPESTFYAGGRKVTIDQVDLGLSEIEEWRFCSECAYSRPEITADQVEDACPRCASGAWSDAGRVRSMVRLKQVFATSSDSGSRSYDDSDNRDRTYFNNQMSVESSPDDVTAAFVIDDESLPYGFEFLSRASFREVNYGEKTEIGEPVRIAGIELPRRGFELCTHCGKVQRRGKPPQHALTCSARDKDQDTNFGACIYLYREFSSEAIRMLLPFTTAGSDDRELHSFVAGLHLGLKRRFGGQIDHLQVTVQDEPIPGTTHRRRYLFLYDTVPGGTGYLKELMREPEAILDIIARGAEALASCSCTQDPEKDGCYRCLYAYRHSWQMSRISRSAALDVFSRILDRRNQFSPVDGLDKVSVNALLQSELEKKFVEVLAARIRMVPGASFKNDVVSGKPGYLMEVGDLRYRIEPQVSLGSKEGVKVPSKSDFVIWPSGSKSESKPIVVFTDGYAFHHDRLGVDTAQRMAILRSGRFLVWSLTWSDVDPSGLVGGSAFEDYIPLDHTRPRASAFNAFVHSLDGKTGVGHLAPLSGRGSLDWLVEYLQRPNVLAWETLAYVHALMNVGAQPVTSDDFSAHLQSLAPDFVAEDFPSEAEDAMGLYTRVRPGTATSEMTTLVRVAKAALATSDPSGLSLLLHLDDGETAKDNAKYERAWAGVLRVSNLYQFLSGFFLTTRSGLEQHEYDPLDVVAPPNFAWQEVRELVAVECDDLLDALQAAGLPAPESGFELDDASGQVLASAELGWLAEKVALLREDEWPLRAAFEAAGWQVRLIEKADAVEIVELVSRS